MVDTPLFDVDPVDGPPEEQLSPGRRRTRRQHGAALAGAHPLALVFGAGIRRHDDEARTCGNCQFRTLINYHNAVYPKCTYGNPAGEPGVGRISHGAATDVRARWPACSDHEPRAGAR